MHSAAKLKKIILATDLYVRLSYLYIKVLAICTIKKKLFCHEVNNLFAYTSR